MQLEKEVLDKMFPQLEELLDTHTLFFSHLLERKRNSVVEGRDDGSFIIRRIGDVLLEQVRIHPFIHHVIHPFIHSIIHLFIP